MKIIQTSDKSIGKHYLLLDDNGDSIRITTPTLMFKQVVKEGLLKKGKGLNQREENKVVRFIENNQDNLREMSLRVALKLADIIRKHPRQFEEIAKVTVTKGL